MFDNDVTELDFEINAEGKGIEIEAPCTGCGCMVSQLVPWSAIVRMYRRDPVHPWQTTRRGYRVAWRCPSCAQRDPKAGWIVVDIGQDEICDWYATYQERSRISGG